MPAAAGADGGGVLEEAVRFFLGGQAGEPGVEGMVRRQEGLLAMQERRIGAGGVVVAVELPRPQRQAERTH